MRRIDRCELPSLLTMRRTACHPLPAPLAWRLVVVHLLLVLSLLAVAAAGRGERGGAGDGEDSGDDSHDHTMHSSRVHLQQLPGMTLTADELAREEHWTGMLPVNAMPSHRAAAHRSQKKQATQGAGASSGAGSSQLFYWLVKSRLHAGRRSSDGGSGADEDDESGSPLVIWLNGGPGCSSVSGLIEEHGPFFLEANLHPNASHNPHPFRLVFNRYSWSNYADVLYVDQPVGVGFSHLHDRHDLVRSEGRVASDFYRALSFFLTHHHPEYRRRQLYLSGESYAAKYVPAIAAYILNQNRCLKRGKPALDDSEWSHYNNTFFSLGLPMSCPEDGASASSAPSMHMRLSGLLIGNGDYSPLLQRFASRPITLSLGLMDVKQANQYSNLEEVCMADLRRAVILDNGTDVYMAAFESCGNLEAAVTAFSAGISEEDMRSYDETFSMKLWLAFMNHPHTRRALHVPRQIPVLDKDCSALVESALSVDSMKDIRGLFSFLLMHLRVTVYTGNFDLLDGSWSNEVFLDSLWHWKERAKWFLSRRYVWRPLPCSVRDSDSDGSDSSSSTGSQSSGVCPPVSDAKADEVYGYSKSYGHLSFVVVAQAGHMVATTQPARAHDLFYRFLHDLPYYNPEQNEMNDDDAQQICAVLQCDRAGHGWCDTASTDCMCRHGWTGTACTIPVWRITDQLFKTPLLGAPHLSTYTYADSLPSQSTHMFYFSLDDSMLDALNTAHKRHERDPHYLRVTPGRQRDRLSSAGAATCTFEPPLQLKVVVRETGRSASSPFHLSTSVFWNSYFQNADSSSAIRFFGDFDPSNLFLGRNLHGDRQSLGPRVLSILTSPSAEHVTLVGLTQCDHYAIKVGSSEGSIDDIGYELQVTLGQSLVDDRDSIVASARTGQGAMSAARWRWLSLLWSLLPWGLFAASALGCAMLSVRYRRLAGQCAAADEDTPLLKAGRWRAERDGRKDASGA